MEYLSGSKQEFFDFLNKLEKKDRIAVITHIDLDGIASAILINEILKQKKMKISSLSFINYEKGMFEEAEKDFKKGTDKVFILDINVNSDYEGFKELKKKYNVFLIDHHPSELESDNMIKTKTEDCVTFAIFEMAKHEFDLEKEEWLVCATMIAEFSYKNKNNFEFIKKHYPEINLETISYSEPGKISDKIYSATIYFKGKEKRVFDMILKDKMKKINKYHVLIEKEIQKGIEKFKKEAEFFPKNNLYFYYDNPKFSTNSVIATILSIKEPEKSFIFVHDTQNKPDFVSVSSRNQNGKENMNLLMKKGIVGLENATAGGHVCASGGKFLKKDLEKFKENILR
jgi:oligoribonuclease NrnB/cAMP/cGMP phosphodiesterase (DHH superfamily)